MATPTDGDENTVPSPEFHAAAHVVDVHTARHRERMAIVGQVPNLPCVVIAGRPIAEKAPMQALTKIVEIGSRSDRGRTTRYVLPVSPYFPGLRIDCEPWQTL
jgi:hypothetical protein